MFYENTRPITPYQALPGFFLLPQNIESLLSGCYTMDRLYSLVYLSRDPAKMDIQLLT